MKLLELKTLTAEIIQNIITQKKEYTQPEHQHLFTLLSLKFIHCDSTLELIKQLLYNEHPPVYSYEIKKYLRENSFELYQMYANLFINNPGVLEGFNLKRVNHTCYRKEFKPTEIKTLEPVFKTFKKKKDRNVKKNIRRECKKLAGEKIKKLIDDKKEYGEKIKGMMRKIQGGK